MLFFFFGQEDDTCSVMRHRFCFLYETQVLFGSFQKKKVLVGSIGQVATFSVMRPSHSKIWTNLSYIYESRASSVVDEGLLEINGIFGQLVQFVIDNFHGLFSLIANCQELLKINQCVFFFHIYMECKSVTHGYNDKFESQL